MDKTAIEAIQALAHAKEANEVLLGTNRASALLALPKDYQLADLEKYGDRPHRFRGTFSTTSLPDFMAYANAACNGASAVFVDAALGKAEAVIDLGDAGAPLWKDHRAALSLKRTAEFEALLANADKAFSQRDLIDFVEDWDESLVFFEGDFGAEATAIMLADAVGRIRRVKVESQGLRESDAGDFAAGLSSTDRMEVKAHNAPLPCGFEFHCAPYDGFAMRAFRCRLRAALAAGDKPALQYRIQGYGMQVEQIGQEFCEILKDGIGAAGRFYQGRFS